MKADLEGRVALITGATGDTGMAIAKEFYAQGASVVLTGRSEEKLQKIREKLISTPTPGTPEPLCICRDLTTPMVENVLVDQTVLHFGKLDIVVNAAAIVEGRFFAKTDDAYLGHMMHMNFNVPYNICRAAIKPMCQNKYGRIINITSIAGYMGDAAMSTYAATKGALASATKSIAAEYARRGITANCIAPGVIDTGSTKKLPTQRQQDIKNMIPCHRFGKPEEVAYLAAFLASERAAYINGQQIHINGGWIR